jgi:hypothetical protein
VGVRQRLSVAAARRPHVLLVAVPGRAPVRWTAEDLLDSCGWSRAQSPAAADLLLCCGQPGPALTEHVEVAWNALPGPRARATAAGAAAVRQALDAAAASLGDLTAQQLDARRRPAPRLSAADSGPETNGEHEMSGDMDMDKGMELPGGLVMADRMEDRDGLRLEGLNLSLGPLLPDWPAGLRMDVGLSGDVLTRAEVVRLDPRPEPPVPTPVQALDALGSLLGAAGWSDGALRARRARAEGGTGPRTDDLLRRLRRARLLRWSLRRLPGPGGGDLVDHLDRLVACMTGDADLPAADDDRLASDVIGLDLGTAALVVAAHGPLAWESVRA